MSRSHAMNPQSGRMFLALVMDLFDSVATVAQVGCVCQGPWLESFVFVGRVQRTFHGPGLQSVKCDPCRRNAPRRVAQRILSGKILRHTEYWVCMCKHWASSAGAKGGNHKSGAKNAHDGKPPRGPILSDWVGKVLGKSSEDAPVLVPIDVDDDDIDSCRVGSHLERAPVQTAELSCLVDRLEAELSAALVERRGSWPLWRQARRHQRQIEEAKKPMAKLEERELEVVSTLDVLHLEVFRFMSPRKSCVTRCLLWKPSMQGQRMTARVAHPKQVTNRTGRISCSWQ